MVVYGVFSSDSQRYLREGPPENLRTLYETGRRKIFFWLFLSSNDRSCRETYKSKILLFSNASMKNAEFHNFQYFRNRLKNEFFNILTLF